jgi:hypothetical protein
VDADVLRALAAAPLPPVVVAPGVCACGATHRGTALAPDVGPLQWLASAHARAHAVLLGAGLEHLEADAWGLTALICRAEPLVSRQFDEIVGVSSQK